MKKKLTLTLFSLSLAVAVSAEGYQVNTLSARQGGMGHTGVSLRLGSESVYFNPAGLGFMDKTFAAQLSGTFLAPTCTADVAGADGTTTRYKTDNKVSTPLMATAAFSVNDKVKVGLGFYTPYGSNINWGKNWAGAVLNQNVALSTYTVQPTVAWRPLKGLSVGAGLMVSWGKVDLNKGLIVPSTYAAFAYAMTGQQVSSTTVPASVNLKGTSSLAVGVNVGVMYEIDKRWAVGVNYRSQQNVKVKTGDASVTFANDMAEQLLGGSLGAINSQFKSEMPMPWVLTFGGSYKPVDNLTLALEAQLTGWHAYRSLDVEFLTEEAAQYNQYITKDYTNSWLVRLGAEYAVTKRFDARLGFIVDTTPVSDTHYNPETPGMTKLEPTLGCSFRPIPNLSIDLTLLYVAGMGKSDVSCVYDDVLAKTMNRMNPGLNLPEQGIFVAKYDLHALSASIGLSYSF